MRLASPPTYLGTTMGGSDCSHASRTVGFAPAADGGKHPLFVYFVGTQFVSADQSSYYDSPAAKAVTEAMARRGFVALSVEYDNLIGDALGNKLPCLYGKQPDSLLAKACALPEVDCTQGIATWGHSQGALLAHMAATFDPRVRAVWTTGYGGIDNPTLPASRFRVVNGEGDSMNAQLATMNKTAGFSSAECPDDGRDHCLRADGSGWIVVRKAACESNAADHCWFDKRSCTENQITLEPSWVDATSSALFALEANADWVAATVLRP